MNNRVFSMRILGRTIEHLGTQMYKHRAPSIAELVANSWDAHAEEVDIFIPTKETSNSSSSVIAILDNGDGMNPDSVQNQYLMVGRNRRKDQGLVVRNRKVMGRKGIGKLAGFGLADTVTVTTWMSGSKEAVRFSMHLSDLKNDAGQVSDIEFPWEYIDVNSSWPDSGTLIELSNLKHTSLIDIEGLHETLSRRFSRTIHGEMIIRINGENLRKPNLPDHDAYPDEESFYSETLPDGNTITYKYSFTSKPIRSSEMQGFVIYANKRTAQAPPFFFNVESTASGQHSTRYITGEINADFIDDGIDDESDIISTDRQELDWAKDNLAYLRDWGETTTRKLLRECGESLGKKLQNWVLSDQEFASRLDRFDPNSFKEVKRFLKVLGQKADKDDSRTRNLADALIRAYEFRSFHDVVTEIEGVGDDPDRLEEMLTRLHDWKVLESRAILEIVRGRLEMIIKLQKMIINDAPETAPTTAADNLHDLLAEFPWMINPDWQVFVEEKSISKQLREWGYEDNPDDMSTGRVDFLAFSKGSGDLIVIELKRPGHAVDHKEMMRLDDYQVRLMRAHPKCKRVLIYGGTHNIPENRWQEYLDSSSFEPIEWSEMFARSREFYSHYEAVLTGDTDSVDFHSKEREVARTRGIIESGTSYRGEKRITGVGSSD